MKKITAKRALITTDLKLCLHPEPDGEPTHEEDREREEEEGEADVEPEEVALATISRVQVGHCGVAEVSHIALRLELLTATVMSIFLLRH